MPVSKTTVSGFLKTIAADHKTKVVIREELSSGKSGAFVALVDCSGAHDGVYVLKIDALPAGREDEESRHKRALFEGAFNGRVPKIELALRTGGHYCLLMKMAGDSRLTWRPAVNSVELFKSAYMKFADAAWTPNLFSISPLSTPAAIIAEAVGYKLTDAKKGRIKKHIAEFIGVEYLTEPQFLDHEQLLPNPYFFATSSIDFNLQKLPPLLGPIHGDCHAQNLFVRAHLDSSVSDVYLIDFATYESKRLHFFDHAYLELATVLRQMDQIGERRWLEFVLALSENRLKATLRPDERGWAQDIFAARRHVTRLAKNDYANRMDDLQLQFMLAQVSVGLSFIHKMPRKEDGPASSGLSVAQYRQSFVWAAGALLQYLKLSNVKQELLAQSQGPIPVIGRGTKLAPNDKDWKSVKHFDARGFNVLVVGKDIEKVPLELSTLSWSLVLDFRQSPPAVDEFSSTRRVWRQLFPGDPIGDMKLLTRGGLWFFSNGRDDISSACPTTSSDEWRRRYSRFLQDLLRAISLTLAPHDVRVLMLSDGLDEDKVRIISQDLDTTFHKGLAPIAFASDTGPVSVKGIASFNTTIEAAIGELCDFRAPLVSGAESAFIPWRRGSEFRLETVPTDLLARIDRDLTLVHRGLSQGFPPERIFGADFRRGMPIEWAELAQNLDITRSSVYAQLYEQIENGLKASSNHTVNLLHEPSSGGTTLSRRLAWEFMEEYPVLILNQLSGDTATYLRDIFHFSSLPLLVVMEAPAIITESEREALVGILRDDNVRAVFLWVSRFYGSEDRGDVLKGKLDQAETSLFLEAYLEQVSDETRRTALKRLAAVSSAQRNPFFFGLTAFGEKFLGVESLIQGVLGLLKTDVERDLLADLALVSVYYSDGFPAPEFEELCNKLNAGNWPVPKNSLLLLTTTTAVKISHSILADRVLAGLARDPNQWRIDLARFSNNLLEHIGRLNHVVSDRVKALIETLFITRDIDTALQADTEVQFGGIASQRRFSPLILELGNVTQVRALLRTVVRRWAREPHYAAHLARHLLYESPKEIEEALGTAMAALQLPEGHGDAPLNHVVGMCHRIRMEERLLAAKEAKQDLAVVEGDVKDDFDEATTYFRNAIDLKPVAEHGHVATIQAAHALFKEAKAISGASDLASFLKSRKDKRWYFDAMTLAEDKIETLRARPHTSARAAKTIAEWGFIYDRVDKVIGELRVLTSQYEDPPLRRALCSAIVHRSGHLWHHISQSDLQTIALMMERNINNQNAVETDIARWLSAYRRIHSFKIGFAIERLVDWHKLFPKSSSPAYYLYIFNFLRWLAASSTSEKGQLADEVLKWISIARQSRLAGEGNWSFEWLQKAGAGYTIVSNNDLSFKPTNVIKTEGHPDRKKLDARLSRISGTMRVYRGPQNAELDLGQKLTMRITPLDKLTKDDLGKKVSAFASFSIEGIVGWDPILV